MHSRARQRGFTLIELMTVVLIVGIMATIAVVGYRKHLNTARLAEGLSSVQYLRGRMLAANGGDIDKGYPDISTSLAITAMYPTVTKGTKTQWGGACGAKCNAGVDFKSIDAQFAAPVAFKVAIVAGISTMSPSTRVGSLVMKTRGDVLPMITGAYTLKPEAWFVIRAGSPDDAGTGLDNDIVVSSFQNDPFVDD